MVTARLFLVPRLWRRAPGSGCKPPGGGGPTGRSGRRGERGAGPDALEANAAELRAAGDPDAAQQAVTLWERETGRTWSD